MPPATLDRPGAVRAGEELDLERLGDYLRHHLPELDGTLRLEQFPRGFSNLTYLLRAGSGAPDDDGERQLVLRRPPFGSKVKSAHDMGREHRILSHLAPVYPKAPRPLLFCDDPAVIGAPFYVMERVEGVILRPDTAADAAPEPARMAAIANAFVDTLVELHAVDYEAAGLGDLGKPEGYVERQIAGWTKRYQAARTDDVPAIEQAAEWLAAHRPPESGAALIHNDFKYDNLVLDPARGRDVVAVLDWEMATIGDPLMDLGTSLGYWTDPDDPPAVRALALSATTLPGNPDRATVAARYAERSGRALGDLVFYYVYGLFKIAVIVQQIYYRYRKGLTRDPRFAGLIEGVRGCGLAAERAIERGSI